MESSERNRTLEDHLVQQVKKSGYPLEIEISNLLDSHQFVVFNSQYYYDEDLHQERDIDIYACPRTPDRFIDSLLPFYLKTEIAIECKKSETHAWVFYTRPRNHDNDQLDGQLSTSFPKPKTAESESSDLFLRKQCLPLHYDEFDRVAVAYDELKKNKDSRRNSTRKEIFEGTNQLVKFINYENHKTELSSNFLDLIKILFPVMVFDGDMFEVIFNCGEPELKKANHVLLSTHRRCPYCQESKAFTIDVVHRSYFNAFIQQLIAQFLKLNEAISEKKHELSTRVKEDREIVENEKQHRIKRGSFG